MAVSKLALRGLLIGISLACTWVGAGAEAWGVPREWRTETLHLPSVEAQLKVPVGATGRLPAILVFGGFEHAGEVLELLHPSVPVILASFNYPYTPPRKFAFPESLRFAPDVKRSIHDTLRGIGELQQALAKRAEVDASRISILGASFGAPFAAIAAREGQLQGRPFASLVLVHAFGDVPATAIHQLMRKWGPHWGSRAYLLAWIVAHLGWWYVGAPDPEEALRQLGPDQQVLVITAADDQFIPPSVRESLWKSLASSQAKVDREVMPGDHLQPGSEALIDQLLVKITQWLGLKHLLAS